MVGFNLDKMAESLANSLDEKMMKKYDLVFTIECLNVNIADAVKRDMEVMLKKLYRDIIVKSKTTEHPTFEGVLDFNEMIIKGE